MEKHQQIIAKPSSEPTSKNVIWDCNSSLYDSFELKSFENQLNSAIVARSLSMPHLSERTTTPPPPLPPSNKKPTSKLSRSIHRLFRAVFRAKSSSDVKNSTVGFMQERSGDGFYFFHDRSGVLSTIPEVPEFDALSPEIRTLVRRTASDRFTAAATSVGISCSSIGISGHFSI